MCDKRKLNCYRALPIAQQDLMTTITPVLTDPYRHRRRQQSIIVFPQPHAKMTVIIIQLEAWPGVESRCGGVFILAAGPTVRRKSNNGKDCLHPLGSCMDHLHFRRVSACENPPQPRSAYIAKYNFHTRACATTALITPPPPLNNEHHLYHRYQQQQSPHRSIITAEGTKTARTREAKRGARGCISATSLPLETRSGVTCVSTGSGQLTHIFTPNLHK